MAATPTTADRLTLGHASSRRERAPFVQGILNLRRNRAAMIGAGVMLIWILIAIFAPLIAPYDDPKQQNLDDRLLSPSRAYPFGTDDLGRDVFSRVIYGARISIPAGLGTIAVTLVIGATLGAIAGYAGGWADSIIMRVVDVVLAFPSIILAMAITAARGGPGLENALLAIVLVLWPEYARVMRGTVLSLKSNEYVTAAEAVGASRPRILLRHILPGAQAPLVVKSTLDVGAAIVLTAGLSFHRAWGCPA